MCTGIDDLVRTSKKGLLTCIEYLDSVLQYISPTERPDAYVISR